MEWTLFNNIFTWETLAQAVWVPQVIAYETVHLQFLQQDNFSLALE
jgi:hypothetical protein